MPEIRPIIPPRAGHGAVARGEDHGLALLQGHDLTAGLGPRPLLDQEEFAALEVGPAAAA